MTRALLRAVAIFLGHLLTALLTTAIIEDGFWNDLRNYGITSLALRAYILSSVIPFALGYGIFWKWRSGSAKWIWIAGLCWFVARAHSYWLEQAPLRVVGADHSVFWEMSGLAVACNHESALDFLVFTLFFVRTVFYSAGAWCGSLFGYPSVDWHAIFPGLLGRRDPDNIDKDGGALDADQRH